MVWKQDKLIYEIDSMDEKLQRLLDNYNQITGSNFNIDEIKNATGKQGRGTGIHAILYTYLQDIAFIESGILDLEGKCLSFIITTQQELKRPTQMKDNIKKLMLESGIELIILDENDKKHQDQLLNPGIYIIIKDQLPQDKLQIFSENLTKCIVAGVRMNGDKDVIVELLNTQQQKYKYTEATKLENFKVQLNYTKGQTNTIDLDNRLKRAFIDAFKQVYSIGLDFNVRALESIIDNQFPELNFLEILHSTTLTPDYFRGYYQVPYNKYLSLEISDISTFEV